MVLNAPDALARSGGSTRLTTARVAAGTARLKPIPKRTIGTASHG
jgi:hypothetical protein